MTAPADRLNQAFAAHRTGDLTSAAAGYLEVLARQPDNPHALHLLAVTRLQAGDIGGAIALAETALHGSPPPQPLPALRPQTVAGQRLPEVIQLELTSDCNLRCTYCPVSLPDYQGRDMPPAVREAALDFIRRSGIRRVGVNSHGETTLLAHWVPFCQTLLDLGLQLEIISNFAKPFSDAEIDVLARFSDVRISIDTVDKETLRRVRKAVDVRTVLHNWVRLRARRLALGLPEQVVGVNCVVTDQVVFDLEALVSAAAALGARVITLHDLAELAGNPVANSIVRLPRPELERAVAGLRQAAALAQRLGMGCVIQPSLGQLMARVEAGQDPSLLAKPLRHFKGGAALTMFLDETPDTARTTRDCIDPWTFMKVDESGQAMSCCISATALGKLPEQTPEAIFNGPAYETRRRELLTGQLDPECSHCPIRERVPVATLRQRLTGLGLNPDPPAIQATQAIGL